MHDTIQKFKTNVPYKVLRILTFQVKTEHLNSIFCLRHIKQKIPVYLKVPVGVRLCLHVDLLLKMRPLSLMVY